MRQQAPAAKLAADLLHEQINFPAVLPNEPDVVKVDKAPRPVHEAKVLAIVEQLVFCHSGLKQAPLWPVAPGKQPN